MRQVRPQPAGEQRHEHGVAAVPAVLHVEVDERPVDVGEADADLVDPQRQPVGQAEVGAVGHGDGAIRERTGECPAVGEKRVGAGGQV